jgi:hypothetical protein
VRTEGVGQLSDRNPAIAFSPPPSSDKKPNERRSEKYERTGLGNESDADVVDIDHKRFIV